MSFDVERFKQEWQGNIAKGLIDYIVENKTMTYDDLFKAGISSSRSRTKLSTNVHRTNKMIMKFIEFDFLMVTPKSNILTMNKGFIPRNQTRLLRKKYN